MIGQDDKLDVYQFTLRHSSNFSLALTRLKADANVTLFNSAGTALVNAKQPGKTAETIATTLAAGTYYLRINSRKDNTGYTLRLTAVTEPGATLSSALNVGALVGSGVYSDTLGGVDESDYYQFTLNQNSDIYAELGGLTISADINLIFDANGNQFVDANERLTSAYVSSFGNKPISETLPPGTYFVEVRTLSDANSRYNLTLSTTAKPSNIPTDPGDALNRAYDLGRVSGTFTAQDLVGALDKTDYYKFTLDRISDFNATLSRLSGAIDLNLIYDINQNNFLDGNEVIATGFGSTSGNNPISATLPAGTYFVAVKSSSSYDHTGYDLALSSTSKPDNIPVDPGSSLGTAYNLGLVSGQVLAQDLVGSLDKTDYYKFTLSQSSSFNATLSGLSNSVNISLIADKNQNGLIDGDERIAYGFGSTYSNSPITRTLQAGTYFVEVGSNSPNNNTAYTLTLAR